MSGPRGIQLSSAQIIASVLATLTGAVAASYLGVAGTLVGAALGSIASTMGTEVYKHYLLRSQERLRAAGQVLVQSTVRTRTGNTMSQAGAGAARGGRHAASGGQASQEGTTQDLADRETAVWDRRRYGAPRDPRDTQMIPGIPTQWGSGPDGGGTSGGAARPDGGGPDGDAASGGGPGGTASRHAHGKLTGQGPASGAAGRGGLGEAVTSFFGSLTRRQWLTYGGIAAGFFLVIMAAITVFELTIGKPLSAAVTGGHSTGTSLFGHSSPPRKVPAHPSSSSSPTPAGSTPASPTPTAGTPSGTPTPSTSVGSTSPSTLPSSTPTTGSSAAARSSTKSTTLATPTP